MLKPVYTKQFEKDLKKVARRECHIESDWLLIYRITEDSIFFERTGSHSDLFG
ncbi:MAG: type II toxin-antitoxin system YafQ family toxin [Candidatus Riflebacteria bacterium]|nr:type II toxin-antitoxin system YafQ family toxin [Candidatus Riflebacteria bacterium]